MIANYDRLDHRPCVSARYNRLNNYILKYGRAYLVTTHLLENMSQVGITWLERSIETIESSFLGGNRKVVPGTVHLQQQ